MRTINLPDRETSREYLARVKAEKEAEKMRVAKQILHDKWEGVKYSLFVCGVLVFGILLYAVFCPVKG